MSAARETAVVAEPQPVQDVEFWLWVTRYDDSGIDYPGTSFKTRQEALQASVYGGPQRRALVKVTIPRADLQWERTS